MGRAKFDATHRKPEAAKVTRKASRKEAAEEAGEIRRAGWAGYGEDVRRLRRSEGIAGGDATSKRKPHGAKLQHTPRYNDDGITSGNLEAPRGTFVQFGARSKEGKLQLKNRTPEDRRKAHKCNHTASLQQHSMSMDDAPGGITRTARQDLYKIPGFTY